MRLFRNINKILKINIIALFSSGVVIINFIIIAGSSNIIIKLTLEDDFLITGLSFMNNFSIIELIIIISLKTFYKIFNKNY